MEEWKVLSDLIPFGAANFIRENETSRVKSAPKKPKTFFNETVAAGGYRRGSSVVDHILI